MRPAHRPRGVEGWGLPAPGPRGGEAGEGGPTSSSCSSWDALLPPGAGGAAPPGGGGGGAGTPSSSAARAGAHAAGGGGGCARVKPPGSPSSDRVPEPEEDSAEEAPGEGAAARAGAGIQAPRPLQLRGTGSGASETFSPISLTGPKCRRGAAERGARSAPPGQTADSSAPARSRSRCRSGAARSPAGDYMSAARPPGPAAK